MTSNFLKKILIANILLLIGLHPAVAVSALDKPIVDIQSWTTTNGAKVLFVPAHELPIIDIQVMFDAGSARDNDHFGLAGFTSAMLDEGTSRLNADQIAEQFDDVGAQFSKSVSRDAATVSLRSLTDPKLLTPAIATFTEVLAESNFPDKNFARVKKQILTAIKEQEQAPATIAAKAFYETAYGTYPYGHSPIGNNKSVLEIKTKDLQDFYKQYYVSNNATIAIVGDINRKQAESLAEQIVGKLPEGSKPVALGNPVYQPKQLKKHISYPASQTNIIMGSLGIKQNDEFYFPMTLGNHILGGGALTSRLFKEVRDSKGYTYNVYSSFVPMRNTGPFIISLTSRNEAAANAINLSQELLSQFVNEGPSEKELIAAKKFLIGSFPLRVDNNSAITSNIAMIGFYNLPLNYLDTYRDNLQAVTKQNIVEAFKTLIKPEQLVVVTVGPQDDKKENS